jgi:hypothetical protein
MTKRLTDVAEARRILNRTLLHRVESHLSEKPTFNGQLILHVADGEIRKYEERRFYTTKKLLAEPLELDGSG